MEVGVRGTRSASVPSVLASLSGDLLVDRTLEAVHVVGDHTGSEAQLQTGEFLWLLLVSAYLIGPKSHSSRDIKTYTVVNAASGTVNRGRERTEVFRGEDSSLSKLASPLLLIPPGESTVEATLVAHDLLESPDVVTVP